MCFPESGADVAPVVTYLLSPKMSLREGCGSIDNSCVHARLFFLVFLF